MGWEGKRPREPWDTCRARQLLPSASGHHSFNHRSLKLKRQVLLFVSKSAFLPQQGSSWGPPTNEHPARSGCRSGLRPEPAEEMFPPSCLTHSMRLRENAIWILPKPTESIFPGMQDASLISIHLKQDRAKF